MTMEKDTFTQWLDDRMAHDPNFDKRMQAALTQLRVDRLAAAIRGVRARHRASLDSRDVDLGSRPERRSQDSPPQQA